MQLNSTIGTSSDVNLWSVDLTTGDGSNCQWIKNAVIIPGETAINYSATTAGTYKCKVTKTATGCSKNSNAITVSVPCRDGDQISDNDFNIYPNPATNFITIETFTHAEKTVTIQDALGRSIISIQSSGNIQSIDVSLLPAGFYFIQLIERGELKSKQFVIER